MRIVLFFLVIATTIFTSCNQEKKLTWNDEEGYRWAELSTEYFDDVGFEQQSPSVTNITFENNVTQDSIQENRHFLNGSGVAASDINADGLVDLYVASLTGENKLYQNLGNLQFKDITRASGTSLKNMTSTGVVFADVNNDQLPDLLVSSLNGSNQLFLNQGNNQFKKQPNSGLGAANGATTFALADVNKDGWIDLYITNYKKRTVRDLFGPEELSMENTVQRVNGKLEVKQPFKKYYRMVETAGQTYRNEIGQKDEFYINNKDGTFRKVDSKKHFFNQKGKPLGLQDDWGLTARFQDVNGDHLPDLYVANDFWSPDRFWINKGNSIFWEADSNAIRNTSFAAMGIDFSDINRDGITDFMVTEMLSTKHSDRIRQYSEILEAFEGSQQNNRNSVYLNRGDNTYAQIAQYSHLEASGWSWGTHFLDVDLDGYEDLFIANGFGFDYQDMDTQLAMRQADQSMSRRGGGDILRYPPLPLRNKLFKNLGDLTFSNVGSQWGFKEKDIAQGTALADLDNDGDLDIITNRFNDQAGIFMNKGNNPRLAVRLKGNASLISGATIVIKGTEPEQSKTLVSGGNYLSGSQHQAVFAANLQGEYTLIIEWTDGLKSVLKDVKSNRLYEISTDSIPRRLEKKVREPEQKPMFVDESSKLSHRHQENSYDDFKFGPLLPHKLSEQGPGLGWIDFNSDGMNDLVVSAGKNGKISLLQNLQNGDSFKQIDMPPLTEMAAGDQTALGAWEESDGVHLLLGSANYEQGNPRVPSAYVYTINNGKIVDVEELPGILSTTGPVAAADYTGDGSIDLFIGGSFKPGQYPKDATSRLFVQENNGFAEDRGNRNQLENIGLVTDALFVDFNNDGWQDLLLSTEWGTLKLFENRSGRFTEITEQVGLDTYQGWWRGIAVGDFTGNGLPDIVAANIGENSFYQVRTDQALRLYYGDLNSDGRLDVIDSYFSDELNGYVPRRKLHDFGSIPNILRNVSSHQEFATSTLDKIFNRNFERVPFKKINTLKSMVFLNEESRFTAQPLPPEAQLSTATFAGVADVNSDGAEDLFLSQNYSGFPQGFSRQDAGRGLLLMGSNSGQFQPVSGSESGIKIYGEQRGAAFGDFNSDGKVDLAVSQNDGATQLLKNRSNASGYSITLVGGDKNRTAVGSSLRLQYDDGSMGPRVFITAGSGYRSQNSSTKIMGFKKSKKPTFIHIRWYDGSTQKMKLEEDKKKYVIRR